MSQHSQKLNRITTQLKNRSSTTPVSLKKKAVRHQVPNPLDKRHSDPKIDISDLNQILEINLVERTCTAEPGVTFVELVRATLQHGLVPYCVPEQKTITIGGAVAGCSIESMSYKYGGFHDSCLEYEFITAKGDVLNCTPDNEHNLIFKMVHGTFGTLGIISKLKFRLVQAKPYVKVTNEKYPSIQAYKAAIFKHYQDQDVDFMDGLIFSSQEYVLCIGNFVDTAPYTHNYEWTRIYYEMAKNDREDYLKTIDYFFRYDKGTTHVDLKSPLSRFLFGRFVGSTNVLWFAQTFHKILPARIIPVVIDVFLPFEKLDEFLAWHEQETHYFPLWCVPYKAISRYEWLSEEFHQNRQSDLLIDIAIYAMKTDSNEEYYRKLEQKLLELGGLKTLIADNYFTEDEFWRTWHKGNYHQVKQLTDPQNIFRDLYEKTVQGVRGLGR